MKIINRKGKKVKTMADLEPYDLLVCEDGNYPISHISYSSDRVVLTLIIDPAWRTWWNS